MSNNVMFTMEDVANMLIEIEDIKESNSYYESRGPLGVDFIQSHIALEMLAYKTYIAICKQDGLFVSNLVRYEHCQLDLAMLRNWQNHSWLIDNLEPDDANWMAEQLDMHDDAGWEAEELRFTQKWDNNKGDLK